MIESVFCVDNRANEIEKLNETIKALERRIYILEGNYINGITLEYNKKYVKFNTEEELYNILKENNIVCFEYEDIKFMKSNNLVIAKSKPKSDDSTFYSYRIIGILTNPELLDLEEWNE